MGASFSVQNDVNTDVYATYTPNGSEFVLEIRFTSFCSPHLNGKSNGTWDNFTTSANWTSDGDQVINMTVSGFASRDDANSFYTSQIKNQVEPGVNLYSPGQTLNSASNLRASEPELFWGVKVTVTSSSIELERGYLPVRAGSADRPNNSYNMSSTNWSYSSR